MTDFERIDESLNRPNDVKVTLVTLSGVNTTEVRHGMTVSEFKAQQGLCGAKLVDEDGNALANTDVITSNMSLYISTPKKNG